MMILIFIILLAATICCWMGNRRVGLQLFVLNLVVSVLWFAHHMTSSIPLEL